MFHEAVGLTGLVLTKLDGTAKGGIAVRIEQELGVPIKLVGVGEQIEDLQPFEPEDASWTRSGERRSRMSDGNAAGRLGARRRMATRWMARAGPGRAGARPDVAQSHGRRRRGARRRVVGEGSHQRAGGPHAEVAALAAAGRAGARRHPLRHARAVQPPWAARRPASTPSSRPASRAGRGGRRAIPTRA